MNRRARRNSPTHPPGRLPAEPLLDLRLLVLVTVSALVGLLVAVLTWLAGDNPWAAALAGLIADGVAFERLHSWTGT